MIEGADAGGSGEQARFRVKLGAAEIEFEGGAGTLEKIVMPTVNKMIDIVDAHTDLQRPTGPPLQIEGKVLSAADRIEEAGQREPGMPLEHSTHSIAVALKAETGPDLAIAACAHLSLVRRKATLTRKEIATEMKGATGIYNANMFGNLSKILAKLTGDGRLRLVSQGIYALALDEKSRLERELAEVR